MLDTEVIRFEPDDAGAVPESFLEVSARLGAQHVLVMSAEPEEARTAERLAALCDQAAPYGLVAALEFAMYTGVRTLAQAARVVARARRPNAAVLVDALHFSRSGGRPADLALVDPALLPYAQICDAVPEMPAPDDASALLGEARTGRLLPGEGVLPLRPLVAALPVTAPLAVEAPCRAARRSPRRRTRPACAPGARRPAGSGGVTPGSRVIGHHRLGHVAAGGWSPRRAMVVHGRLSRST